MADAAAMGEQLAQGGGLMHLRQAGQIARNRRIQIDGAFLRHQRRQRGGDRLGAAAHAEFVMNRDRDAKFDIGRSEGLRPYRLASPHHGHRKRRHGLRNLLGDGQRRGVGLRHGRAASGQKRRPGTQKSPSGLHFPPF